MIIVLPHHGCDHAFAALRVCLALQAAASPPVPAASWVLPKASRISWWPAFSAGPLPLASPKDAGCLQVSCDRRTQLSLSDFAASSFA